MGWIANGTPELEAKSEYPLVISICVIFSVLMIFTVGMRLYVRRERLALDDVIVVFGGALALVYNSFAIVQTKYGLGLPVADRPTANLDNYSLFNYAGRPFLMASLTCFKIALCITYLRMIDRTSHRGYRMVIWTFMGLLTAICIFGIGFNVFNCTPIAKSVHPLLPGSCLPYAPWNLASWSINIILDVLVFLLPIPLFMRMKIDFSLRLELSILFSLSLITTVLSIWKISQVPRIGWGDGNSTQFVYLSALEANVGLIVSCLPHLKPLYNWRKGSTSGGRSTDQHIYGQKSYKMSRLHSSAKDDMMTDVEEVRNDSQDRILHPGITKTTFISVDHVAKTPNKPEPAWN